ncbi:IclR family transcriptional regulator [Acidisphaera sp. L21]|jgi:DNA-binding IclR family transcriptional regulator|uniref:IclR family transcriptional regulator n=1 Tax=Acidisphaera sp. L21 TaxID=1641851 RepID=UPI00131D9BDB|nr:IclR family transcriptional regulator [Acidisphaera sp. L21]
MDKAFTKGLQVIEALARSESSRGITGLATELGLTKSNVHRLLGTLQVHQLVAQNPSDSTYTLTTRLWELGSLVVARLDLSKVASGPMSELAASTGETVHLSILDGAEVIYISKIESLHAVRAYSRVGGRAPAWSVATGKALLAHLPSASLASLGPSLTPFTETTIATVEGLIQECGRIRARGYAVNRGEWRADVFGIGAPIADRSGTIIAAVGISGPASRLRPKHIKAHAPAVVKAAHDISVALGASLGERADRLGPRVGHAAIAG